MNTFKKGLWEQFFVYEKSTRKYVGTISVCVAIEDLQKARTEYEARNPHQVTRLNKL